MAFRKHVIIQMLLANLNDNLRNFLGNNYFWKNHFVNYELYYYFKKKLKEK